MAGRNWFELLHLIYTNEEEWKYYGDVDNIDATHPLVTETNLGMHEARAAYSFLTRHNLIEESGTGSVQLTTKGFEVARQREIKQIEAATNQRILGLTIVLALTAVLQAFTNLFDVLDEFRLVGWIALALIALGLGVVTYQSMSTQSGF